MSRLRQLSLLTVADKNFDPVAFNVLVFFTGSILPVDCLVLEVKGELCV